MTLNNIQINYSYELKYNGPNPDQKQLAFY